MIHRPTVRVAGLLLALAALGCSDDGYKTTDLSGKLEVTPLYYGIDEGFPPVQFTATIDGAPVNVTWESSDPTIATVTAGGLVTPVNDGFAAITATLASDPRRKKSASFTVNELFGTPLQNGVPVTGIAGVVGDMDLLYRIYVPEGTTNLTVAMSGGTGDFDLYVRRGPAIPTYDDWDCRPYAGGNNESCSFTNPQSGTWYIWLDVYDSGAGVQLVATRTP